MSQKRGKWVGILVSLLAIAMLVGCSGNKDTGQKPSASDSGSKAIKLKFVGRGFSNLVNLPGYEDRTKNVGDYLKLIADEYTKLHPEVTFDVLALNAADGTTQQLDVEIAGGNVPNVMFDQDKFSSKYKGKGLLETLDGYLTQEERNDFISGALPDKGAWKIPMYFSPKLIALNKTLFEKAGAANLLPKPDSRNWTTDEYLKALQAVNNPPSVYATILFAKTPSAQESIMGYFWPFGAQMFKPGDYGQMALNSPEGLAALKFYKGLLDSKLTVPSPAGLTDDDMWAMFEKQQLAVAPEVPLFESMAKDNGFEVYYVAYPHPPGKDKSPMATFTESMTVFKNDDANVVEASVKFAKYVADVWGPVLAATRDSFPLRNSQTDKVELSSEKKAVLELIRKEGMIQIGQDLPQWNDIREKYVEMDQMVFLNNKTPEEALKWFEDEVNGLLKK